MKDLTSRYQEMIEKACKESNASDLDSFTKGFEYAVKKVLVNIVFEDMEGENDY